MVEAAGRPCKSDFSSELSEVRRELRDLADARLKAPLSVEQEKRYELLLGREQLLLIRSGGEPPAADP